MSTESESAESKNVRFTLAVPEELMAKIEALVCPGNSRPWVARWALSIGLEQIRQNEIRFGPIRGDHGMHFAILEYWERVDPTMLTRPPGSRPAQTEGGRVIPFRQTEAPPPPSAPGGGTA